MAASAKELVYYGLLLAGVVLLALYVSLQCTLIPVGGHFRKFCTSLKTCMRSGFAAFASESTVDLKARAYVMNVRTRLVVNFSKVAIHILALVLSWSLVSLLLSFPGVSFRETTFCITRNAVDHLFVIDSLLWFFFCFAFAYRPQLVTFSSMTFLQVVMSIWWAATASLGMLPFVKEDPRYIILVNYLPRMLSGFVVGNSRAIVFCNIAIGGLTCAYATMVSVDSFLGSVIQEVICTAVIVSSNVCFDRWAWTKGRLALDTKLGAMSQKTALCILFALCDAVVTLGPDLHISQRAPKLANLLSQNALNEDADSNFRQDLVGANFVQFLVETDRDRFRDFVARGTTTREEHSADPEPAQALNVHLQNSNGRQVQLFHSEFRDSDDQVRHVIAVCEIGEVHKTEASTLPLVPPPATWGGKRKAATTWRQARGTSAPGLDSSLGSVISSHPVPAWDSFDSLAVSDAMSNASCIEDESEQSWFEESASARGSQPKSHDTDTLAPLPTRGRLPQVSEVELCFECLRFTVNTPRSSSPVLDVSWLEREGLLQWISDWESCRAWMQDFVNASLRPVGQKTWPQGIGVPSHSTFEVSFQARCALPPDFLTRDGVTVDGGALLVRVPVEKVTWNPRLQLRRKESKASSRRPRIHRTGEMAEVVQATLAESSGSANRSRVNSWPSSSGVGRVRRMSTISTQQGVGSDGKRAILGRRSDASSATICGDQRTDPLPQDSNPFVSL
eukprot:TRINITY_DN3002_c0_g1_i3.p1 TRINITY_DN3002_c0_g1~~TRINITY_DN3002_c0_g1_i3.p1  ORF type:complete len:751 (+),score=79.13 TRINITY_DN3002_c0_g1_i3:57-2255(+)